MGTPQCVARPSRSRGVLRVPCVLAWGGGAVLWGTCPFLVGSEAEPGAARTEGLGSWLRACANWVIVVRTELWAAHWCRKWVSEPQTLSSLGCFPLWPIRSSGPGNSRRTAQPAVPPRAQTRQPRANADCSVGARRRKCEGDPQSHRTEAPPCASLTFPGRPFPAGLEPPYVRGQVLLFHLTFYHACLPCWAGPLKHT